ncbi:hypothetical protein G9P44_000248 [Scheffersomyces stipitis]|nr:hypothetical protein G9P44_000248 [Scheffersomyces stipitis]
MTYIDSKEISKSYYEVLLVDSQASEAEIKASYKKLLLSTHPDKTGEYTSNNSITLMKEAYKTLVDPVLKAEYDESLTRTIQKQGFNLNGDGLDTYGLNEFDIEEDDEDAVVVSWSKSCPRCQIAKGMVLSEENLAENGTSDGNGGYDIIVQCSSCSLWIKVKYYEEIETDSEDE